MRRLFVFYCAFLLLTLGCGSKPPDQKLLDDIDPAASWIAALKLTAEDWLGNRVPTKFVRNSTAAARKEFENATRTVEKSKAPRDLCDAVRRQLTLSSSAADALEQAVEQNDRRAAAAAVSQFAAAHDALDRLQQQSKGR